MTWHDAIIGLVFPCLGWLARSLWTIRTNHLAHMQASIDHIETMLLDHLKWHAEQPK